MREQRQRPGRSLLPTVLGARAPRDDLECPACGARGPPESAITTRIRALAWSATPGRQASYTKLGLSNQYGPTFWTLIVDGDQFHAVTPSLTSLPDLAGLSPGAYDAEVTRVLNPNFEMDDFMSRDFSIYKRTSWSINRADITAE